MAMLWQRELGGTRYQVRTAGATRRLYTDGVFHSAYNPRQVLTGGVWDLFLVGALLRPPETVQRVLLLGVGAGTALLQFRRVLDPQVLIGVDLDMVLLLVAGAVSAALGVVGIYGTVAYVVSQKTREFGLRMALGASAQSVRWRVLSRAAKVGGLGIALGLFATLATGGVLESLLFGVAARDPIISLGVAGALFTLILTASLVPASRASSVDPVQAMRVD